MASPQAPMANAGEANSVRRGLTSGQPQQPLTEWLESHDFDVSPPHVDSERHGMRLRRPVMGMTEAHADEDDAESDSESADSTHEEGVTPKEPGVVTPGRWYGKGRMTFLPSVLASQDRQSQWKSQWRTWDDDEEHEDVEEKPFIKKWWRGEERCCTGARAAHICYVLVFLGFLVVFPFFLKWMISAPVPQEFWNKKFDKFPFVEDWKFVQNKVGNRYNISISHIPTTWSGCNHSCSKYQGRLRTTSEMNFKVDVKLEAPDLKHTAYPVLLASNDFDKWYVAADRRHAKPQEFFASETSQQGYAHRHVTDKCTRPPEDASSDAVHSIEQYSSRPTYLMACIAWSWEKVQRHQNATDIKKEDVAMYCDSVGGTCGWPCGSSPRDDIELPGCQAGKLSVNATHVADVALQHSFRGDISVRPCLENPGSKECITSIKPMSRWPCHKCLHKTKENYTLDYDSYPQLEILLQNAGLESLDRDQLRDAVEPHVFVLSSPLSSNGKGPDGLYGNGVWKKLYEFDMIPRPRPEDEPEPANPLYEALEDWQKDQIANGVRAPPPKPSPTLNKERHSMEVVQQNKLTLEHGWCFGKRGPLYLVACALNSSTYDHDFDEFKPGQMIAPPPFNDRCLVVSGRCAFACMENQPVMKYCEDGVIPQKLLDSRDKDKPVESRKNDVFAVHLFILTLLFGFAVKMLAYFPGLFTPYTRAKNYTPEQTDQLKYIAIVTPSGGETKACVLRNLVGGISTCPKGCKCSFNIVFADEGHRHQHKIMFRALVSMVKSIPDMCLRPYKPECRGFKMQNMKIFMQQWVEDTKKMRLNDCNTDKLANKIRQLDPESAEAKKLQATIDALCGLQALRQLQKRRGWPESSREPSMSELENAILSMREELVIGEKKWNPDSPYLKDARGQSVPKAMHLDDCEDHQCVSHEGTVLFNLHYVARAKPDEDERTIKVQHVARGIWCYKLPKDEAKRNSKKWLDWRKSAQVYKYGSNTGSKYLVPLRTSRGKAGGLNFAENYLFDFCRERESPGSFDTPTSRGAFRYSLLSIADARHQFQPDFLHETMPFFFKRDFVEKKDTILNTRVAFTQCPQYFQEMPDDSDYLDTNNSNFFRLGCMLRNCCGGVSSCGTNGTWLIRDRRAGIWGTDSVWDLDHPVEMRQEFSQVVERQFFHESCKVEDTASSLDRVVKGKYSQYINMRLSYGMAKEATDYLAAVQRWAEGGVVLSLQTFLGRDQGIHMIWFAFLLWVAFVISLIFLVYGIYTEQILGAFFRSITGDDGILKMVRQVAERFVQKLISQNSFEYEWKQDYEIMVFDCLLWLLLLALVIFVVWMLTAISRFCHTRSCCGRRKVERRTRFPTSMAQWARLFITVDNLTYFLWFWTAFFWVGFNYYGAFFTKGFYFDPQGMLILSWFLQVLSWSLIIASCFRYTLGESLASNEVFFLTLTNIWRTTQMFYITAPLTLFSIFMGTADFSRNRSFGEDISYWVGGDRGAAAKNIVKYWTLLLVVGVPVTWACFIAGVMEEGSNAFASVLVVSFIGLDAIHPCAYLWLGTEVEVIKGLEEPPKGKNPGIFSELAYAVRRCCQKLCSPAWHKNALRQVVFSTTTSTAIKWIAPVQHVLFPALSIFFPVLGVQSALNILAGLGR